ncbi:MAG: hypothetical protein OXE99_10240 [Cellvibrionales bacterium]|nr:hypothetical protein [Cellvibrionales bacterium]
MESATYFTDVPPTFFSHEKKQSAILPLTEDQRQLIIHCLSALDLEILANQVYRRHLSDPSYTEIKKNHVSLAALVELQRHHWEMMGNLGYAFDVVKHCLVDMGVVYAKVKLEKPLLEASLKLLKTSVIDLATSQQPACCDELSLKEALGLFFAKLNETALTAYDYYKALQQEQVLKASHSSAVRSIHLSPYHLYVCVNQAFALDVHWQTLSDRVLMMLGQANYQQIYFDLSCLSEMNAHEKEFIIFDVKQYCFIKNIELFIIGLDDAGLEDVLMESDDIQDRKVHFCSSLETAILMDKPFVSSVLQ